VASGGARALPGGLGVPPRLEKCPKIHLFYKTLQENLNKNLSRNHLLLHVSERNGHQRLDLGGLTIDSVHTLEASETPQTRCLNF